VRLKNYIECGRIILEGGAVNVYAASVAVAD